MTRTVRLLFTTDMENKQCKNFSHSSLPFVVVKHRWPSVVVQSEAEASTRAAAYVPTDELALACRERSDEAVVALVKGVDDQSSLQHRNQVELERKKAGH